MAASLLVAVGSAAHINQVPAHSILYTQPSVAPQPLFVPQAPKVNNEFTPYSEGHKKKEKNKQKVRAQQEADDEDEEEEYEEGDGGEWWGENQDIDFDQQDNDFEFDEHKNAQGFLGALETAVNVGDEVAKTINPAIPTVNLSNKGNTVTLKVAGKLAEKIRRDTKGPAKKIEKLSRAQTEGIINAIEKAVSTADVNLAVSDKAGQPPTVKGSVSFKLAQSGVEGILNEIEKVASTAKVNLAVSDKAGQPPTVSGAVSFKLAQSAAEGIINSIENALSTAKVNVAVSDKAGQPPEVKGAVSFKLAQAESEGIINSIENALSTTKVNLAVSDKAGQPPEVKGAVSFKLAQTGAQGIINAIEKAVSTADVNLAVSDKAGQPPTVKGSVSFKLAEAGSEFGMLGAIEEAVNVGDKVAQTINPAIPTVNLSNKGNTVTLKVAGKLAETQAESQSEFGMLGAIEEAVNVGDKVAQTINPAIPSVNLSNKGNTVTLKVAGKI